MKILSKCKDGGSKSPVDAYFLFEIKWLFSIALLKFNKGCREDYHSHAFDALTWFLSGNLTEERIINPNKIIHNSYIRSIIPKFTSKDNLHRVKATEDSWCITLRGRWKDSWKEYNTKFNLVRTLTNGRITKSIRYAKTNTTI